MDLSAVKKTISELRGQVEAATMGSEAVFSVDTKLVSGVTCEAQIREFPPMVIDEPPVLAGSDSGPNPVELILAALGTCQEIMYAAMASLMDIELDGVEVSVKGYLDLKGLLALDEQVPAGYREIKFETRIESSSDPEKVAQLISMVESHCPILDTIVRPVPVNGKQYLNGERIKP